MEEVLVIDYEKLRIVHELAYEAARERGHMMSIQVTINYDGEIIYILKAFLFDEQYRSIDAVIEKLKKITKKHPKYKAGDKTYCNWLGKEIKEVIIERIMDIDNKIQYVTSMGTIKEELLYATRIELINAQIDYWQSLKGI